MMLMNFHLKNHFIIIRFEFFIYRDGYGLFFLGLVFQLKKILTIQIRYKEYFL